MLSIHFQQKCRKKRLLQQNKQNSFHKVGENSHHNLKLKTVHTDNQLMENDKIVELCDAHKQKQPILDTKKIVFALRNQQFPVSTVDILKVHNQKREQNHIDKLKKEIQELEKDDFISYRSKVYSYTDEVKTIENMKISKFYNQNSLIVELKGKSCQHRPIFKRPRTTASVYNYYSAPRKYFSRSKPVLVLNKQFKRNQIFGKDIIDKTKLKFKTQQIAIGHSMMRGKMVRNKNFITHHEGKRRV